MAMRDMPEPGMEDSGGNPLQEGILGDYQNRGVRDESYASVRSTITDPDIEIPAEIVDVIPPDPESIRPGKKQMDKKADFLDDVGNTLGDVAPYAGGAAGFLVGGPAGAAIGAGLGGAADAGLHGGDVGDMALQGAGDAAIGGALGLGGAAIGAGLGGAAESLGAGAAGTTAAGTAEQAAAAGATRGGIGSLMGSAWNQGKNMMMYNSLHDTLLGGGGGGGMLSPSMAPPQAAPATVEPASYFSRTAAPNSTPSSQDRIPSNDTDDPEQVDFHEKNDGAKDGLQSVQDVNGVGGTDTGADGLFAPDSQGLASLAELLPKVLQFALSDEPGANDPDMQRLHQQLETENPGYMDNADDTHGMKLMVMIMGGKPGDAPAGGEDDLEEGNDPQEPHDPVSEHQATAIPPGLPQTPDPTLTPGLASQCYRCGSTLDPSSGHCPQCGVEGRDSQPQPTNPDLTTPQQMAVSKTADTQGPNTDEQKAAVAQLLQQEGRGDEIPNMILEPWNYADELTKITGQEAPPQDIGQQGPPPPVDPSQQQGAMPVPGMSAPPPGGGGAGAGPMMAAISKYAGTVDSVAEPCPKCGSHSTGYTDVENGDCGCKTCHHHWKADSLAQNKEATVHQADGPEQNPIAVSPDVAEQQFDPEKQEDSSLTWTDASGNPLVAGKTYDMYSENYQIPDRIRVDRVKPDVINYTLIGEYGISHETELTHEEADIENTSFVPSGEDHDAQPDGQGDLEGNMDDPTQRSDPGQQSDLSTPHMQMASVTADVPTKTCPECQGRGITPDSIPGIAEYNCPACKGGGRIPDLTNGISGGPQAVSQRGPIDGLPYPGEEYTASVDTETGPDWLKEEGIRTAGAHFTPYEQRDFIEEDGVARNADKMSLSGTHYEATDDNFLFGI